MEEGGSSGTHLLREQAVAAGAETDGAEFVVDEAWCNLRGKAFEKGGERRSENVSGVAEEWQRAS